MNFTIDNIPFGIFSIKNKSKRIGTILNDQIIDLYELSKLGCFEDLEIKSIFFKNDYLNDFISLGKATTNTVRKRLQKILVDDNMVNIFINQGNVYHQPSEVEMHLPIKIGDYTDFYSSEQHATNVGMMFRDPKNALLPNWKHIPVAYHGRSSSVFVSGKNFHRPKGQMKNDDISQPVFNPTSQLDFELEMATIIGRENEIGEAIDVNKAEDYVFGFQLLNDWSARDIQKWEYVPLGPFLAKNFFSSVSPWIITIEALNHFRIPAPEQIPKPFPYLNERFHQNFDIRLEVSLQAKDSEPFVIARSNFKNMYWTVAQQIAHHTVNGCNLNVGDLLGSGTISGKEPESFGSLLELTWNGTNPIRLPNGNQRKFLEDYDTIIIKGFAESNGIHIDFGEIRTTVLPTK